MERRVPKTANERNKGVISGASAILKALDITTTVKMIWITTHKTIPKIILGPSLLKYYYTRIRKSRQLMTTFVFYYQMINRLFGAIYI